MSRNLVVVESPAKARTIERYLGPEYRVLASYGHVRDLPENPGRNQLGVDVEHDFHPEYVVVDARRKQVETIAREAKRADAVYLATDLDREGEAIAWHVTEAANVPPDKARRVTFNEITEPAIRDAFAHPRSIDAHLVDAQQARRVVDRLVGYTLSPLLWRKVRSGLSAGRVQSVAVRLVVEREREIRDFRPREYWTVEATLETDGGETFTAALARIEGRTAEVPDASTAERIVAELRPSRPVVERIAVSTRRRNPAPPFTTSTLQQEASRKLSFSPKRTMSIAQRLYEGVETPEGHLALITYMRTDSTAMSRLAMNEAGTVIRARYGERYAMPKGRTYRTKTRGAQEAHESIRPTSFERDPDSIAGQIGRDELRLYRLIWQRAIASQMTAKEQETTAVELGAGRYGLRAVATKTLFDGFSRVYTEGQDEASEEREGRLPVLTEGERTRVRTVEPTQHFTEPPPRYTEAALVKALEERGIGRPSTYAATLSTIVDRGYVKIVDRRLRPEPVGEVVTDLLVEHFGEFVDLDFTARMEEELDEVARGEREWVPLVRGFYGPFRDRVDEKRSQLRRRDFTTEATDEVCSLGHPMVIRLGRYGRFLACSLYPEHKETRPLPEDDTVQAAASADGTGDGASAAAPTLEGVGETCPHCGLGALTAKRGRYGAFVGCSRYPECDYIRRAATGAAAPPLEFEVGCPKCGEGKLVSRRARRTGNVFWGCGRYPKCDYTTSFEPLGGIHDADSGAVGRRNDAAICLICGARVEVPEGVPLIGLRLPGGPPDPGALARTTRGRAVRSRRVAPNERSPVPRDALGPEAVALAAADAGGTSGDGTGDGGARRRGRRTAKTRA